MVIPINTEPKIAIGIKPAPKITPIEIAQNKNAVSRGGSFIAVLKRITDNAPTIFKDNIIFDVVAKIIRVDIKVNVIRLLQNFQST